MSTEINELAILFVLAAGVGIVARMLKQPLVLAYMLAGVIIGVYGLTPVATDPLYKLFADLGIMFLLFLIGLEINLDSLRQVGMSSLIIGLGQIVFTFVGGFLIALFFGFDPLPGAYIAIALTFSSTIIVVKLLSEKRDLHSLYGKISVGILLVQDFVAILILLFLAGLQSGQNVDLNTVFITVGKGALLFLVMLWLGRTVMPKMFDRIAHSSELLFTVSIAWLFLVVMFVERLGFSIEIGGFLAGLALANSSETFQVSSRIKPLRDFFLLLFFIVLGSSLAISDFSGVTWPAVVFSLFVLVGNPLMVMIIMGSMGYHRRSGFLTGVMLAQVSEFGLVLMALGQRLGHVSHADVTLVTLVGVVTIGVSSYLILNADKLYQALQPWLGIFERQQRRRQTVTSPVIHKPIILIGGHRTGQNILAHVPKSDLAVVDFNPDVISHLRRSGYTGLYGDITDPEIFEAIDFSQAKLIISTSPDVESNHHFITELKHATRHRPLLIMRAESAKDAEHLYAQGVNYVIIPHLTAGHTIGQLVHHGLSAQRLRQLRRHDQHSRKVTPELI